jgi:signal peptidase I
MRAIFGWLRSSLPAIAFIIAFRVGVVDAYHVPTGSMRPTILEGDRFLAAKFHYRISEPERGEIAVFRPPETARPWLGERVPRLVKRIVAVEGDVVEMKAGALFVNGLPAEEPYLDAHASYSMGPIRVPPDHVLVLGDNRDNSLDGHIWGFLPESHLKARVFARYWPLGRVGRV